MRQTPPRALDLEEGEAGLPRFFTRRVGCAVLSMALTGPKAGFSTRSKRFRSWEPFDCEAKHPSPVREEPCQPPDRPLCLSQRRLDDPAAHGLPAAGSRTAADFDGCSYGPFCPSCWCRRYQRRYQR